MTGKHGQHPYHRLTETAVHVIREKKLSHRKLAAEFGVSQSTIQAVLSNRTWKGVK